MNTIFEDLIDPNKQLSAKDISYYLTKMYFYIKNLNKYNNFNNDAYYYKTKMLTQLKEKFDIDNWDIL